MTLSSQTTFGAISFNWISGVGFSKNKLRISQTIKRSYKSGKMESTENKASVPRGSLIVLEGLDRSGKSSQCAKLVSYLQGKGLSVEAWRFPDRMTGIGQMISSYLSNESQLDDKVIHLLFSTNRWEKRVLMEKKLTSGTTLIVDRYSYSGVAFSAAKGLDFQWCRAPDEGLIAPDLVIYLDIPPEDKVVLPHTRPSLIVCKASISTGQTIELEVLIVQSGPKWHSCAGLILLNWHFSDTWPYQYNWVIQQVQQRIRTENWFRPLLHTYLNFEIFQKAAERGGYGTERYEKLEFQKKVAEHYYALRDSSWEVVDGCLKMESVEEQLRKIAMNCILKCQSGKPLANLWSANLVFYPYSEV